MAMKFKGDLVHTEKYEDRETKEEKKKYVKVGALFEREDGSLCVKFLGGWLNVYPPKATDRDFKKLREEIQPNDETEIPF
jgi:hypothetical protein